MATQFLRNQALNFLPVPFYSWIERKRLWQHLRRRRPMPRYVTLKPVYSVPRWSLLFLYLPDGVLDAAQRDTIQRLRSLNRHLLIVCAAPLHVDVPAELFTIADALIWKELPGFDFSAYAIGLNVIASASPNSEVFVVNDSVYGPLQDVEHLFDSTSFDLTGFILSQQIEPHIQSFAFLLRNVNIRKMICLRHVFPISYCYDDYASTVLCLETRFARVAARHMSVGALWSLPPDEKQNPSLLFAMDLLDDGFPFLKRRLVIEPQSHLDQAELRDRLNVLGLPEPKAVSGPRPAPSLAWA